MDHALAEQIARLEARLAIQNLRHTYWLAISQKDLETMLSCYTADSRSEFGFGYAINGADETRAFYTERFADEALNVQVPYGTNGLVTFVDDDHADGSWLIQVCVVHHDKPHGVRNQVRYEERYERVDGTWKIAFQRTNYLFFERFELSESPLP